MKKLDLLIFIGLSISLVAIFTIRFEALDVSTEQILENQRLIRQAINAADTNNELILANQEVAMDVLNRTNDLETLIKKHIIVADQSN